MISVNQQYSGELELPDGQISDNPSDIQKLSERDKVNMIEREMLKQPQLDLPLKHYFSPGVYARELFIPAGVLLTGKIHKYAQLNILSQGDISVLTDAGMVRVQAPFTVVSPPGTKRIAFAHTDCTWTTILHTDETDPELIEQLFTCSTEEQYLDFRKQCEALPCPS